MEGNTRQLVLGIILIALFWFASWMHLGILGEYAFFPLWLGYIFTVDALVARRKGVSLLSRHPREFVALFLLSAPVLWIFEGLNRFVQNWHYLGAEHYPPWQYILVATIDFSTVIPAIFETTELVSTFSFPITLQGDQMGRGQARTSAEKIRVNPRSSASYRVISPRLPWLLMYVGALAFAAVVLVPQFAFPLTWVWLVLLIDPLNYLRGSQIPRSSAGRASLLRQVESGDWRLVVALALAALVCGFFWEMWNFYAMPKWYYTVPFFGFAKVFEMPLLGYGGYLPFAWELYALHHLVWGVLRRHPIAIGLGEDSVRSTCLPDRPSFGRWQIR